MRMIMETRATRSVLRVIIQRDYTGSQADFSEQCGLDTADTSRVIAGIRPATVSFVRRATGALREEAAAELITAFLSDISSGVTDAFSVTVAIKAKYLTAMLSASDDHRRQRHSNQQRGANERHDEKE